MYALSTVHTIALKHQVAGLNRGDIYILNFVPGLQYKFFIRADFFVKRFHGLLPC